MARVRFGIYTLSVYDPRSKRTLSINDISGGRSLFDIALPALRARTRDAIVKERSDGTGVATQFSRIDCDEERRLLHGLGRHGSYGQGSTLLNVVTSATTPRTPVDADLRPHYFLLDGSGDSKNAILLVQVAGRSSLLSPVTEVIESAIKDVDEVLQVKRRGCIPGDVLRELAREGTIKTFEVVKKGVPQDHVDPAVEARQTGTLSLKYTVRNGLGRFWKGRLGLGDDGTRAVFVPAPGLSEFEEYDTLKVHVKVGRSSKTVDLGMLGDPQPYLFPDQTRIGYGDDGNPLVEDVHRLALEEVAELRGVLDELG